MEHLDPKLMEQLIIKPDGKFVMIRVGENENVCLAFQMLSIFFISTCKYEYIHEINQLKELLKESTDTCIVFAYGTEEGLSISDNIFKWSDFQSYIVEFYSPSILHLYAKHADVNLDLPEKIKTMSILPIDPSNR